MREAWVLDRQRLNAGRHDLTKVAASLSSSLPCVAGTALLCRPDWVPDEPIALGALTLRFDSAHPAPSFDGTEPASAHLRAGFGSYAEALGALARPAVFENRPAYRLLDASLAERALTFGPGSYFDGVNVGEAVAHELAAGGREFRSLVGDPRDFARRPALPAISTLTLRAGPVTSFVLHFRDAAKVAHGGGLHQVMPVGVFQPVNAAPGSFANDFDLWRGMVREYSEEFLGRSESYGDDEPLDYDAWPFYRAMTEARDAGLIRVYCLGLGVDPLTWATDLLTVAVFDPDCFDDLFGGLVQTNTEGTSSLVPFERKILEPLLDGTKPIQAAGAAALSLAAIHWAQLA
ncbi:hypothetical protein [Tenggerimyces flavus]|uniref:Transcriptional regulator n=1 Tax=Tenggerimyces flavus TaxID=1708749 RepID=A0ABV7Y9E2_9ACTN|nr:hypothetical protein [Tenggerimyces flavus]MBM7785052.1 hypothetical protein [Tenggerimyces flavus]